MHAQQRLHGYMWEIAAVSENQRSLLRNIQYCETHNIAKPHSWYLFLCSNSPRMVIESHFVGVNKWEDFNRSDLCRERVLLHAECKI